MNEEMWWTCPMASSGLDRFVYLCKPWISIYSFPFLYLFMWPLPFLNHLFCVQTYMYTYVCIQIHMLVHVKNRCCCSVSSLLHPCFEGSLNELGPQWFDQRVLEVLPSLLLHWDLHVCQESKLRTSCLHASIPPWAYDDEISFYISIYIWQIKYSIIYPIFGV